MEKKSEGYLNDKTVKAKHKLKDSIFTNLFRREEYILELYQELYPKDRALTKDDIQIVTLENIFLNYPYNDLGFLAGDRLLVFVEAQSTWSKNILIRVLVYIARTLKEYITEKGMNVYGTKKIIIPQIDAYVIYIGEKGDKPDILDMEEEFFQGEEQSINVKVKVLYDGEEGSIINQYIRFTKVYDKQRKQHGRSREAITETIRFCKENNILKQYLTKNEKEVIDIMDILFDQGYAVDRYAEELAEARAEERAEKREDETRMKDISSLIDSLKVSVDQAMELLKIPEAKRDKYREMM